MADLFSYRKKQNEDGSSTTKFNIHPVINLCLIAAFVTVLVIACEAVFGK